MRTRFYMTPLTKYFGEAMAKDCEKPAERRYANLPRQLIAQNVYRFIKVAQFNG